MNSDIVDHEHYEVSLRGDHIRLKFKGFVEVDDLKRSTEEIVALAKRKHTGKLLDDVRDLDRASVTIRLQTEAIGLLWHLRDFKKIAMLYNDSEIGRLVATTLETIHLTGRCRVFENEVEAIKWLEQEND